MMTNERLLREWVRRILREKNADLGPGGSQDPSPGGFSGGPVNSTTMPSKYDNVDWDKYLKSGDSLKTLRDQMAALADLSQKLFPASPFYPPGTRNGSFTITPQNLTEEELEDSGDEAGTAFQTAFEASLERNKGLRAEDGLAAFYLAHGIAVSGIETKGKGPGAQKQARQAAGEDLKIGNQIAELKTSEKSGLNLTLNSTAPHDDPNRWYIFLTNRDRLPATVYVINSQVLFYRNFAKLVGASKGGAIDSGKLKTAIHKTLTQELGRIGLEDIITQAAMGQGREKGITLSFSLGGLTVRLRLMFTLGADIGNVPLENEEQQDLEPKDIDVNILAGGTQEPPRENSVVAAHYSRNLKNLIAEGACNIINDKLRTHRKNDVVLRNAIRETLLFEELTKSDKKEIERIARKQAAAIVKRDALDKREIERLATKKAEEAIKKALGVSFIGAKGDINKFVADNAEKGAEKWLKDKAGKQQVADVAKMIIKKLYKQLAVTSPQVIDRIKV